MITLINTFHDTETKLRITELTPGQSKEISKSTYNRIRHDLCGVSDCQCGDVRGGDYYMFRDCTGRCFIERKGNM